MDTAAPSYESSVQDQVTETGMPPSYSTSQQQAWPQSNVNHPLEMTSEPEKTPALFTKQDMDLPHQNPLPQSQYVMMNESTEAHEIMKIVNKMAVNIILKKRPADLQCQFCKEQVTTIVELSKLKHQLTAEQNREMKFQNRLFLFIPLLWPWIPFYLIFMKAYLNSSVPFHQCPNCSMWIGMSFGGRAQYCTIPGTKEEQFAELRRKLADRLNETTSS